MDVQLAVNAVHGVRVQTVRGPVTTHELLTYLSRLYEMPDFDPGDKVVWDFREADLSSLRLPDTVTVRDHIETKLHKQKPSLAALVVHNDMDYALTTMFQTLIQGPEVRSRVFYQLDKALTWLSSRCPS